MVRVDPLPGIWVANEDEEFPGEISGWVRVEYAVELPPMVIRGSDQSPRESRGSNSFGSKTGSYLREFSKGFIRGAASGAAVMLAIAVFPEALPVLAVVGTGMLAKEVYDWAIGGFHITPEAMGEFLGGFALGGWMAKGGSQILKRTGSALRDVLSAPVNLRRTGLPIPSSERGSILVPGKSAQAAENVNLLQNVLAEAKPTSGHPNQFMTTLDDGTRVLFREDFGAQAHPLNGPFKGAGSVDHYNIQIQSGTGKTLENVHIVPDGKGGYIWWGKDGVIKP